MIVLVVAWTPKEQSSCNCRRQRDFMNWQRSVGSWQLCRSSHMEPHGFIRNSSLSYWTALSFAILIASCFLDDFHYDGFIRNVFFILLDNPVITHFNGLCKHWTIFRWLHKKWFNGFIRNGSDGFIRNGSLSYLTALTFDKIPSPALFIQIIDVDLYFQGQIFELNTLGSSNVMILQMVTYRANIAIANA